MGPVRTWKEVRRGTHLLEGPDPRTGQDVAKKRACERHMLERTMMGLCRHSQGRTGQNRKKQITHLLERAERGAGQESQGVE